MAVWQEQVGFDSHELTHTTEQEPLHGEVHLAAGALVSQHDFSAFTGSETQTHEQGGLHGAWAGADFTQTGGHEQGCLHWKDIGG